MSAPQSNIFVISSSKTARRDANESLLQETTARMMVMANVGTRNAELDVACLGDNSDGTFHLKLFFVLATVPTVPVLILAKSESVRNLIAS